MLASQGAANKSRRSRVSLCIAGLRQPPLPARCDAARCVRAFVRAPLSPRASQVESPGRRLLAAGSAAPSAPASPHLVGLNASQREAVEAPLSGATRVLAGPGSGKTRVLTARVAQLIHAGVPADRILCITFTNKAAAEMRTRLEALLGVAAKGVTAGTFHAVAARMLRGSMVYLPLVKQSPNFVIYDQEDSESLVRSVLEEKGYRTKLKKGDKEESKPFIKAGGLQSLISRAKNSMPVSYGKSGGEAFNALVAKAGVSQSHELRSVFAEVFEEYNRSLERCNALDFDDLLSFMVAVLTSREEVCEKFARKWPHVLVDEFQDTNLAQFEFVRALARPRTSPPLSSGPQHSSSLVVVGDADQSIYGWRGAEVELMRTRVATQFPGLATKMLPDNYRSTPQILAAAEAVLAASPERSPLRVRPVRPNGAPVNLWCSANGTQEAERVAAEVKALLASGVPGHDIGVLFRANWQTRQLEQALLATRVPHVIVGGTGFFARREVKDLVSYLRVVSNSRDDVAFRRILNVPPRGVGSVSVDALLAWASQSHGSEQLSSALLADVSSPLPAADLKLSRKARCSVEDLRALFRTWVAALKGGGTVAELLRSVIRNTDYQSYLSEEEAESAEGGGRWGNVQELVSMAEEESVLEDGTPAPTTGPEALSHFLESAALMASADLKSKQEPGAVRLQTIHSSKGLEYEAVFLVGCEDGIIPSATGRENAQEGHSARVLEEERRLFYVAVTRAKSRLYLSHAEERAMYGGKPGEAHVSPFLDDVYHAIGAVATKRAPTPVAQRSWSGAAAWGGGAPAAAPAQRTAARVPPATAAAAASPSLRRRTPAPALPMGTPSNAAEAMAAMRKQRDERARARTTNQR